MTLNPETMLDRSAISVPTAYCLDQVAQVLAQNGVEREEAHRESQLESDRLFQPLLSAGGIGICRILFTAPETAGQVREIYRFQRNGLPMEVPTQGLHYYRFRPDACRLPDALRVREPGAMLYRHLPLVRAGSGVGAMRNRIEEAAGPSNRVLPLSCRLIREDRQRVYRVPAPQPLQTRLFDPSSPDRWRRLGAALLETGRAEPAALLLRVETVPMAPLLVGYLERAARLLGETPGDHSAPLPSPRLILETIAAGAHGHVVDIAATNVEIIRAFQADTDPRALVDRLPLWSGQEMQESEEGERVRSLMIHLASLFTLEEVSALLSPTISFHHGLPGVKHFVPHGLKMTSDSAGRRRSAHEDPAGDFEIGTTASGQRKAMNVEWLRTGCVLAGPPGTGKTTAAMTIVRRAHRLRGDALAINILDPVGFEWLELADELNARVIRFEAGAAPPLRFNPFFAPPAVALADHSATVAALLTAVFPGNRIALAYLTSMILAAYRFKWREVRGEEMDTVRACGAAQRQYPQTCPTFEEFLNFGPRWLEQQADAAASSHHAENVEYFKLRSELLRGSLVAATLSGGWPLYEQLKGSFILSLQSIVTHEVKQALLAIILGLYLSGLNSDTRVKEAASLERLLVLEEAHEVLGVANRRRDSDDFAEGSSELIARLMVDALRTRRKYGTGALILDQSLSNLLDDVLKCCGNIMALRTPSPQDQETLARLMGLGPVEARDLTHLGTGECIARLEGDVMPVRIQFDAV